MKTSQSQFEAIRSAAVTELSAQHGKSTAYSCNENGRLEVRHEGQDKSGEAVIKTKAITNIRTGEVVEASLEIEFIVELQKSAVRRGLPIKALASLFADEGTARALLPEGIKTMKAGVYKGISYYTFEGENGREFGNSGPTVDFMVLQIAHNIARATQ